MHYFLSLFFMLLFAACSNGRSGAQMPGATAVRDSAVAVDLPQMNWSETDSVEFIYYPDPSKQKEYKHRFIRNARFLKILIDNLDEPVAALKACTHNSKFYLFRQGDVYKTVYVSDSCHYLAYAVNADQKFVLLKDDTRRMLDSLKKQLLRP